MSDYPTLLTFDQRPVPAMPQEYLGATHEGCGYTESQPREWTDDEVGFLHMLKEQGYTLGEIAESLGRTETSVSIKLKRIGKVKDTYNDAHRDEKYEANAEFYKRIKPKTILDLYCGTESFWSTRTRAKVITNDINESIRADLMPYQIRITNIRVERLQEISDEDCMREGIRKVSPLRSLICLNASTYQIDGPGCENTHYTAPRGAFAALIDRISGKGTWQSNPWVFVYEFELVKED